MILSLSLSLFTISALFRSSSPFTLPLYLLLNVLMHCHFLALSTLTWIFFWLLRLLFLYQFSVTTSPTTCFAKQGHTQVTLLYFTPACPFSLFYPFSTFFLLHADCTTSSFPSSCHEYHIITLFLCYIECLQVYDVVMRN